MKKINQCEPDYRENIKECWKRYQDENEERLNGPTIDIGSITIAIGWTAIWFGFGFLLGVGR